MIRWLRRFRLNRLQLAVLACASGAATALIVVNATGRTNIQSAVLAELRERRVVVHTVDAVSASHSVAAASTSPASTPAGTTPASSTPVSPAAPVTTSPPVASGDSGSVDTGTSDSSSSPSSSSFSSSDAGATSDTSSTTSSSTTSTSSSTTTAPQTTYKVKHVFVIALSTTGYRAAFGRGSVMHYLNHQLVHRGTLLTGYRTLGHAELPDYLAMVSGQAPNSDTRAGCPAYLDFPEKETPNAAGLMRGDGCVFPNTVLTIGDQVTSSGHVWKGYIDDMGTLTTCIHPNSGAADDTSLPFAGAEYDTRHNPFIYFHSLLDLGDCSNDDESLTLLPGDLHSASRTPMYSFISPGLCDDASQDTCPDGQPGGLAGEDAFLKQWVPKILVSKAYKSNGALMIVFASSPSAAHAHGRGPVRTGALILSPYARAHHKLGATYNAYSLLRTTEDLLGFTPLGHAAQAQSFASTALPSAVET